MKSVTEFPTHKLTKGLQAKAALTAEGKSEEEVQQSLGETFKLEGEKLKYFINAMNVANENMDKLTRVLVVSVAEGQTAPAKATKVDEMHYVPEFAVAAGKPMTTKPDLRAARGGGKKDGNKPKSSPWGLSPEEIAAKKEASKNAKAAAKS